MDRIEIFRILGIEETKDEKLIKNAYREKLASVNPEDDPEGFKRLRSAYEKACSLAKQPDEGEEEEKPKDTSPSGLWVEKADEIYASLRSRKDTAAWEELFHDDCFLSLEEEENCRKKLLRFLMDHFRLPTDVWKLLDKKLDIVSGAASLREFFPADFIRYIVSKCERGEDVEFDQFDGEDDASYDLFLQYYDRCWQALQDEKFEQAQEFIQNADQLDIRHPVMEICRAELLIRRNKSMEAIDILEGLRTKYPKDAMVCYNTAENLWKLGKDGNADFRQRAAKIYQSLKEENDSHYMANVRLTEWYYDLGQYREAKECAESVLSVGGDPDFMELLRKVNAEIEKDLEAQYRESGSWEPAMELCWCYLQDGKVSKGMALAVQLEKYLSQFPLEKVAEYHGLCSKLYVEEAEYEDSADTTHFWEEALLKKLATGEDEEEQEKDRDRLKQVHRIRMQCYHNLGFKDREKFADAIREGESVLEGSGKDVSILLGMAQIYVEMGEYERCLELVDKLVNEYQVYAAYATSLEAYRRQLNAGGVISAGNQCIQYFPGYVKAYEYMAKVYVDLKRPEDFRMLLEKAENNGVKSVILDAYKYQVETSDHLNMDDKLVNQLLNEFRKNYLSKVNKGRTEAYEQGLPILTKYLYWCPDSYLLVERGVFHKAAHRYEEAKADYEKALTLRPANPYALNGLSQVHKFLGDYEKALVCVEKAILYKDEEMSPVIYVDKAIIYSLLGDYLSALLYYGIYEDQGGAPGIWFWNQKAECYENLKLTEKACEEYERYKIQAPYASYKKQVYAWAKGGMEVRAREVLEKWKTELYKSSGPGFKRGLSIFIDRLGLSKKITAGNDLGVYYNMAGWVELLVGDRDMAMQQFRKSMNYRLQVKKIKVRHAMLSDILFACAVLDDKKLGTAWAKEMRNVLDLQKKIEEGKVQVKPEYGDHSYYDQEKAVLHMGLLAAYFLESDEKIQELLDRESGCRICGHCALPRCREIEGVRIMFLLRTGREQEARERLKANLELQPADEYMAAIRHTVFADQL